MKVLTGSVSIEDSGRFEKGDTRNLYLFVQQDDKEPIAFSVYSSVSAMTDIMKNLDDITKRPYCYRLLHDTVRDTLIIYRI